MTTSRASTNTHPARTAAMVVAAVFLLVGIAGFVPGVTTDYDGMTFAGHKSTAMLLGVFHVSILHNIVHFVVRHRRLRDGEDGVRRDPVPDRRRRGIWCCGCTAW